MPVYILTDYLIFPDPREAEADGLLAIGGDLSPDRLLLAYRSGIFPWFSTGDPILWWSPDPRMILEIKELKVSKSMKKVLKQGQFAVTFDRDFSSVIQACQEIPRQGQRGTWITDEMKGAYIELHRQGYAHSVEVWQDNQLVGGLYGVSLGKGFFGESMFARISNASKVGFITLVRWLEKQGFSWIDCQVYTPHLASLGAKEIHREHFLRRLEKAVAQPTLKGSWSTEDPTISPA